MSTTLREGELQVRLPDSARGSKFDDETHGLTHCMKAVDWIIELPNRLYFVEVKDLDASGAARHNERRKFLKDLEAGRQDGNLIAKFRDSFIYQWACGRVHKPITYLVVIAYRQFDKAMLRHRAEALRRRLPACSPSPWTRAIADNVFVFNERTWNEQLPDFAMKRMRKPAGS